jgi:hypothetical protein
MGLTRIRAQQISDIDYKQAVRVVTLSNISLSGGAPATVDGVNLVAGDRILVAGQDSGSQNGLYDVATLGIGLNGTWVRTSDADMTGELQAGFIVMVTDGTGYKDTQWKLTTNNPIVVGVTALTFEQNSAFAFGNIYANGTAILSESVGDALTITPGNNISIIGNNSSKTITIGVTGISLNSISNGTSNVNVVSSNGNVTVGANGTGNVAVFASTGLYIPGLIETTGNVTAGNLVSPGLLSVTGNITGGNLLINTDAVITGNLTVNGNTTTINSNTITTNDLSITLGNNQNTGTALNGAGIDVGNNSIATWKFNNATTSWQSNIAVMPTANGTLTLGGPSNYWGAVYADSLTTSGNITASGNVSGSYILGNGSQLTGIDATSIQNGTSNVRVVSSNGNVTISVASTSNVAVFTNDSIELTGVANITGNVNSTGTGTFIGNVHGNHFYGNGATLSGIHVFSTIAVPGEDNIIADTIDHTLTFVPGPGISITSNAIADTLTFSTITNIFETGGSMGTIVDLATIFNDLGLITDTYSEAYDLGTVVTTGVFYPQSLVLPGYTVGTLPTATTPGAFIYVSDASGGSIPAFADGSNWRRVDDRSIVT